MFMTCKSLTSLDISNFDIGKVTSVKDMFYGCSSLTTIYAGDWTNTATNVTNSSTMFQGCSSLVGAVAYNSGQLDIAMANPTTGYFTGASTFSLRDSDAEEHIHDYTEEVTDATCTEGGYTTCTCECGDSYTADETEALGHSYGSAVVEPTETEQGYTEHVCTLCGDTYRDGFTDPVVVPEEELDPEEEIHTHSYESTLVEPTETEQGYTEYVCSECGDTYRDSYTDPTGVPGEEPVPEEETHTHSYGSSVTAPTCTGGGFTTYACECGDSYTADETDAVGHSYESIVAEPTETEPGYREYTCSVCGDTYRETE